MFAAGGGGGGRGLHNLTTVFGSGPSGDVKYMPDPSHNRRTIQRSIFGRVWETLSLNPKP